MSYTNYYQGGSRNKITCKSFLDAQHLFTPTADKKHALGRILEIDDGTGRKFRYCQDAGSGISKALMAASAALDTQAITSTAQTAYGAALGAQKFNVLLTAGNAWTDHALRDGWLLVGDGGDAMGDMYMIKDNYWTTSDTVMTVEIADEGGLRTIIAATDDVVLFQSKYANCVVNPTTQAGGVVGVPLADVSASYYFWAQFRGYTPIICDAGDTIVVGEPAGKAGTPGTAGGVGLVENDGTDAVWGTVVYASTTEECAIIDLLLP